MSTVFISYRRASALVHARAVYERLSRELGPGQVFIDLDDMEVGVDFVEQINQQLRGCHVLLALIDRDWISASDRKGQRSLDRANDFVRIEIATALGRGIRVVPILLGDAEMPDADALPDDLKPLSRRQAMQLDFKRFDTEVGRLVAVIRRILANPAQDTKRAVEAADEPVAAAPAAPTVAAATHAKPQVLTTPAAAPAAASPAGADKPVVASPMAAAEAAAMTARVTKRFPWPLVAGAAAVIAATGFLVLRSAQLPESPRAVPAASVTPTQSTVQPRRPAGQVFRDCNECPEMVVIPAGSFLMGSPATEPGREADEGPQRLVTLRSFALGKTEVTQAQWKALMGNNPSHFQRCGDACPVEQVSWNDAQEFVKRLSAKTGKQYALPSEAQWEYAARAGTTTPFHTGEQITTDQANFHSKATVKVASYGANAFGLHDMHGNVWEWVQDCYDKQAYADKAPSDGSALEARSCASRMLRGGSWGDYARFLRAADRHGGALPDFSIDYFGFRVRRVAPIE